MKRKIVIICFLAVSLLIAHYYYGLFTPYNYFTAKLHLYQGLVQIVIYGEPRLRGEIEGEIALNNGFEYKSIGCLVSTPLINGIEKYNAAIYRYLEAKNGKNWQTHFQNERKLKGLY